MLEIERSRIEKRVKKSVRRIARLSAQIHASTDPTQGEQINKQLVEEGSRVSRLLSLLEVKPGEAPAATL